MYEIDLHRTTEEHTYYLDIEGEDLVMVRSYAIDNEGKPLSGKWAVYDELTGELVDHDHRRAILRDRVVTQFTTKPEEEEHCPNGRLSDFIPEEVRFNNRDLIERYGKVKIDEVFDGSKYRFPSDSYKNVKKWALLEDGSVLGFNDSPRYGWTFPRVGTRGILNFYRRNKSDIPSELTYHLMNLVGLDK